MRKLSNKNKIYLFLFTIIVIGIIALMIYAIKLSSNKTRDVYSISTNSVIFDSETNLIDTSLGGQIATNWSSDYFYNSQNGKSYELGKVSVVYEKATEEINIFGTNYLVSTVGDIVENNNKTNINNLNTNNFYKLKDRTYLIISNEIYDAEKTIFAKKYLMIYIDKQGNASILNDSINLKTINPIVLNFGEYKFDVANEKLIIGSQEIDLKLINGSTNEYIPKSDKPKTEDVDMKELLNSYNKLVNDFNQYVKNNKTIGGTNVVNNNNTTVINGSSNSSNKSQIIIVNNKTNIVKRVSLRGAISYPTYIDVSYIITDPEEKYQAVYLLVTGIKNGEMGTEKIILDKYDTKYRITNLEPKSEYTITLGYIEVVEEDKKKTLVDNLEDVINVRTTKCDATITVDRISKGYAEFTFKMTENYAIESGTISLYSDDKVTDSIDINYKEALSKNGFKSKLKMSDSDMYIIKLTNAKYNGNNVDLDVEKKFTYQPMGANNG